MKACVTALFLNNVVKDKKGSDEKFYVLSFLDDDDKSYNCFINKEVYEMVENLRLEKFETVSITLNIYLGKNGYNFSPTEVSRIPFKNDLQEKQNTDTTKNSKKVG